MAFEYLESVADAYLRGTGETVEEAFAEAGRAMTNLMVDVDTLLLREEVPLSSEAETLDLLLVEWLSAILAAKDLQRIYLGAFEIEVSEAASGTVKVAGTGWGERLDLSRHDPRLEVKGVTPSGLKVAREDGRWVAQCVVDI